MKYTYERTRCDCHPETCCCQPFSVFSPEGRLMAYTYSQAAAERLIKALNIENCHN